MIILFLTAALQQGDHPFDRAEGYRACLANSLALHSKPRTIQGGQVLAKRAIAACARERQATFDAIVQRRGSEAGEAEARSTAEETLHYIEQLMPHPWNEK